MNPIPHEMAWRLGVFLVVFVSVAFLELAVPRRPLAHARWRRWPANLSLVALNTLLLRVLFPLSAVGWAAWVQSQGWGLLPRLGLPGWLAVLIAVVVLDLVIYWQHLAFHRLPLLWRLHRMHHADTDYDLTLGAKFHPIEMILSMVIKFAAILALGASPLAVLLFEIVLNGMAMFNHGNFRIPEGFDRWLRLAVVTPDMHRVHHSTEVRETHSNFGFNLSCWDRLFKTYIEAPRLGQMDMQIGLPIFRDPRFLGLPRLLALPFLRDDGVTKD